MEVQASILPYSIGTMFFVEVWVVPGKNVLTYNNSKTGATLLQTLELNGTGDGNATFDVAPVLATVFRHDNYQVPNPQLAFQKDESAYQMYFLKIGYTTFNRLNQRVKTYREETPLQVAIRATLKPASAPGTMLEYAYQFDGETHKFLTSIPDGAARRRTEDTILTFFHTLNLDHPSPPRIHVLADLEFQTGDSEEGYEIASHDVRSGGIFLVNVKPATLVAHPRYQEITRYAVYLTYTWEYEDETNNTFTDITSIITEARQFRIIPDIPSPVSVLFMNRFGGWDSIQFRRDTDTEIKTNPSSFSTGSGTHTYRVSTETQVTYYSSWLTFSETSWLRQLRNSPVVYINGEYHIRKAETYTEDSSLGLTTINLTVSPAEEDNSITL